MLADLLLALCIAAPPATAPSGAGPGTSELAPLPHTEQDVERAAVHFRKGTEAYVQGRYADAIDEFERSYRYSGRSGPLFSLGQAHRRRWEEEGNDPRQLRLALQRYQQYLDADPNGPRALEAERYVAELRPMGERELEGMGNTPLVFTRVSVSSKVDGATVSVDGDAPKKVPASIDVEPGAHRIEVRAPGYQAWIREVDVAEGSTITLQAQPDELDAKLFVEGPAGAEVYVDGRRVGVLPTRTGFAVPPGKHQLGVAKPGKSLFVRELNLGRGETRRMSAQLATTGQRRVAYASFGLGAIGTAVGITALGLAIHAEVEARKIERKLQSASITESQYRDRERWLSLRDGMRNATLLFGITGAALLGAGAILYATDRPAIGSRLQLPARSRRGRDRVDARVAPAFGPGHAGAALTGRF